LRFSCLLDSFLSARIGETFAPPCPPRRGRMGKVQPAYQFQWRDISFFSHKTPQAPAYHCSFSCPQQLMLALSLRTLTSNSRALSRLTSLHTHLAPQSSHTLRTMSTSIPKTMKGVQISKNGGTEVLEYVDMPVPSPGEGQVLIKNNIIGINYIDTYFRSGLYPAPNGFPLVLGREAAGMHISPLWFSSIYIL
jgi:hypothetical protein